MSAEDAEAGPGLERIIMFSDAVIAIAITLLVLDIRLPPMAEPASADGRTSRQYGVGR